MKKMFQKLLMVVLAVSMFGTVVPVSAASTEESFEEIIKSDVFKFEEEISVCTNKTGMKVVGSYTEVLNDEYYAVIEDTTDEPKAVVGYSTVQRVEKARHYSIKRTSDNKVMVQFSLHGIFAYNGSTSACTDTLLNVYNFSDGAFIVTQQYHRPSGMWALADCAARSNTGKVFGKQIRFGVQPDGTVLMP